MLHLESSIRPVVVCITPVVVSFRFPICACFRAVFSSLSFLRITGSILSQSLCWILSFVPLCCPVLFKRVYRSSDCGCIWGSKCGFPTICWESNMELKGLVHLVNAFCKCNRNDELVDSSLPCLTFAHTLEIPPLEIVKPWLPARRQIARTVCQY